MGFRKKVGRRGKPPRKPRKGANESSDEDHNAGSVYADYIASFIEGDYSSRLIHDYNRIMRTAAIPNHGLIFHCRKFTEMSLIAFLHNNGLLPDPKKNLTLDTLISRIKVEKDLEVSRLIMEHLETLRKYGNLSSHHQIDLNSPSEIWDTIETPFKKIGEWILIDTLSISEDELWEKLSLHEMVQRGAIESMQILGSTEVEGSDGKYAKTDLSKIFTDKKIEKAFLAHYDMLSRMNNIFAPDLNDLFGAVVARALQNDNWTSEQKFALISYVMRMAFWSPMTALLDYTEDYEGKAIEVANMNPEEMAKIIRYMDEWKEHTDKGRNI